jgi:nicotinamide phosphoribosyltransferase
MVCGSVNATEHSVMCAGGKEDEVDTFRRLLETYPTGILSVVSDTWDLWKVCTEHVVTLKEEIMARDGKLVIRPDSGDPVDIICGEFVEKNIFTIEDEGEYETIEDVFEDDTDVSFDKYDDDNIVRTYRFKDKYYKVTFSVGDCVEASYNESIFETDFICEEIKLDNKPADKGVIELLWDVFGGTINEQGYKVLDSHIGAIYGDSITIDRADEICKRLEAKGFASTNIVLGVGSFTYQYNTRDTFGFAMKATYVELMEEKTTDYGNSGTEVPIRVKVGREIFKDPITDDGTKKSATGLLAVFKDEINGSYQLHDRCDWKTEGTGELKTIYLNGDFHNQTTLTQIRSLLK